MLHYNGDLTAMQLGEKAKFYLQLYAKQGEEFAYVPYMDLQKKRKRFVKYQWLNEQWVFVDLTD